MHWKANGLDVSSFDSKVLVDKLVDRAILTNELQDLSWVLCLVIATKQVLGKEIAKKLQKITNPILGVQVMHANSLGLLPGYTLRYWEKKIQLDELYGKDWIAIYEGVYHGWLQDPKGVVGNDKYFGKLLSEKVFFYDVEQPEYKIIFHPQGMPAWIQEKVKALVDTYSSGEKIEGFSILIPQSGSSELETRLGKLEIKVEELGEIISDIQANKISFEEASELFIEGEDIY